ncbi:MAG: type I-F CRISPR-associated protein Csy3 [Gammaproteobacteria bacterium]|nr:MAG: type I-F CRISPR-associated protein Csy3 [Gammaproteobacteria bacterium]
MSKIPASVLAFEKKLVPSDGIMYGTTWANRNSQSAPLKLQEKSVRGTISNRLKKSEEGKIDAKIESANLQTVDSCALSPDQDTLRLNFTLKVLSGVENPSACNHEGFNQSYTKAVRGYIDDSGFVEVANRYAANLANGRFFWRNRVGCEDIEININILNEGAEQNWTFKSQSMDMRGFNNVSDDVKALGSLIAETLSGDNEFLLLEINAFAKVGKSQDVYPSEELVLDKSNNKDKKSKILFDVDGMAAMHSQKVGNAIRTIDTWYPGYEEHQRPIAIDPYGAVTNLGRAYRQPRAKTDFFSLFDKFSQGEKLERQEDEHYVMAVLVRGGVFGEKQ